MKKFKTVDQYLAAQTPEHRAALEKLRKIIKSTMPKETEEVISYGMPAYKHGGGRPVVYFAAFKNHLSLYPASSTIFKKFTKELAGYETSTGTVRFTPQKPLPAALVKRIIKTRLAEKDKGYGKKK